VDAPQAINAAKMCFFAAGLYKSRSFAGLSAMIAHSDSGLAAPDFSLCRADGAQFRALNRFLKQGGANVVKEWQNPPAVVN